MSEERVQTEGSVWTTVLRRLGQSWQQVVVTHLAWTVLALLVLVPLVGLAGRLLMALAGRQVVADQDIAYFLLSPVGLLFLVVVAGLAIAVLALETASLMAIGAATGRGRFLGTTGALKFAVLRGGRILSFAARLVIRVLVTVLPFLAAAAVVAWFLISDHDINYYLSERPPEFLRAAIIIGVLVVAMTIVLVKQLLDWALALPLVVFAERPSRKAFEESRQRTAGSRGQLVKGFGAWILLTVALSAVLLFAIHSLGSALVPRFYDALEALLAVLGLLIVLWAVGNLLVTALTTAVFAYLEEAFFERLGPGLDPGTFGKERDRGEVLGWQITPVRAGLLLAAGAALAAGVGVWLLGGVQTQDTATIVAHRGAAGKAPENTLAAVRQAIADGTDWVEIDVQETADGRVIVVHDSDFMKLAGMPLRVWDGSFEEIRAIDVGSWFDPAFAGERVPTLEEVLEAVRGKARLVIELKYYGHDQALEQRVVDIVEATGMGDQVAVMSLKYEGIRRIRALRPDWTVGLLSARALGDLTRLDADFLAVNTGMARPGFVRRAHGAGKQVFVWTVNDPVAMSRMMSLGVDGVITDEPEMARRVFNVRADLSSVERLMLHAAALFDSEVPARAYRDDSP
ncbi:MAG: glycerophosphodiester phosphodiesterase [Gammaproteobacteria bacterium]